MAGRTTSIALILLALATSALAFKCKTDSFQGSSLFTDNGVNQNEFYVVPKDSDRRPGSMQTFAAPLKVTTRGYAKLSMGKYMGTLANTGLGSFQSSRCSFADGSSVEFQGEAGDSSSAAGSRTVFAIIGGTGRFEGAKGTVTETTKDNKLYIVDFNVKVCK